MLHRIFLGLIAATLVTASPLPRRQLSWPDPEPCTGNITGIHDPSIIKEDGVYYRFSTSGNIAIATAPSLSGPWKYEGSLLDNGTSIYVVDGQDIWAPDVTKLGSTFYAYYSVSKISLQNSTIGLATSPSLLPGTWTDHGSINLPTDPQYNLIDPAIFQESPDAPIYFTFGSYWNDVFQISLPADAPPRDLKGKWESAGGQALEVKNLIRNSSFGEAVVEGAFMFKLPSLTSGSLASGSISNEDPTHPKAFSLPYMASKYYYLFFSSGLCCSGTKLPAGDEYKIMVCRSTHVSGPFLDQDGKNCLSENGGTPVLGSHDNIYAPGGQGVMWEEYIGRAVMYYHYIHRLSGEKAEDYKFGFNYLDFRSGWPVVVRA